jgi:anti-sigma regulatory factor (Ser/Thr protein kinase)
MSERSPFDRDRSPVDRGRCTFDNSPTDIPRARRYIQHQLAELPAEVRGVVVLMVSELATNCVRHARTPFSVTVQQAGRELRIEISDSGTGRVEPRAPQPEEPTGRGLLIVEELSDSWGVDYAETGGKTVWFTLGVGQPADVSEPADAR